MPETTFEYISLLVTVILNLYFFLTACDFLSHQSCVIGHSSLLSVCGMTWRWVDTFTELYPWTQCRFLFLLSVLCCFLNKLTLPDSKLVGPS